MRSGIWNGSCKRKPAGRLAHDASYSEAGVKDGMNYFSWHIGDYAAHAGHLNLLEDVAYRRLIDLYMLSERALPLDVDFLIRKIRMTDDAALVRDVLNEFFVRTDCGWSSLRCELEIDRYYKARGSHWATKLTKAQRAAIQGQRNAAKVSATPKWLTIQQRNEIADIYALSATKTASTGVPHNVDHIVPLRSGVVCGLHVPWNLRVITAEMNRSKSNFMESC